MKKYAQGVDIYGEPFHVQDGNWVCFSGVMIYGHNSSNDHEQICLSLRKKDAKKLVRGLNKFIERNK